ncbi:MULTISPECIES: helix-turn-helix domain-containing protein [unclassified Micromonospora]|uniref:helix-turn-helix domain-containing protein n=1 Tax=unclassified Micromonospora TaxID=2617518 RepID=UPI0005B99686|nr:MULTISPECIES: helix-turn-helix transcriptional regulator [unclassified Micromonospora]MCK1808372.1 helix-turn-helix transcriptional regulator [Micromonospora sp. R42106]MCK1830988.1 helix-turn-helix transcriptional regulator [Micromonospora sp. R42003]MCK1844702.1 helix-turn-helix transcriptional regulator [Micromonospora sp. R42004]MCM1014705.1 helix-turn-helix transcriptional regulator [Micromonospora sp. XM-20-01]
MLLENLRIPDDLWSREEMHKALAARDIGAVFRLLARHTGASQTRIGAAVGLEQGYISRIIAGRRVTSIDVLERIADGCGMPDEARMTLGLAPYQRSYRPAMADHSRGRHSDVPANRSWREDVRAAAQLWEGDVNRRELLRQTVFSSTAYTLPALRWFTATTAQPVEQEGRRTVGQPDIDTIRQMTATYRRLDNQYGGGHARDNVTRFLHHEVAPLVTECRYDPATGRRLLAAAAELTQLAGWQAYDMAEHGLAQRYLTHALDLARTAADAGLTALTAEALVMEAHAHAVALHERDCATALHQAERTLDRADRSSDPQWLGYFDEAYLSAKFGHCFHALGQHRRAERFAARSLKMDERYVRGKAFNLALLASVHARHGEPERASAVGAEALTLTTQLRSARAVRYLRDLQTGLAPHRRKPAVRQFITRVDAVLGQRR